MRPDSVARVWSHYNLMNTSMTPSPIYQPIFDSLTNIPYPAYSTSSSSSEDLSIDIHVRQSLAGESPSTPDLLEDLFFTSLEFSRPQMTFTSFTPLVTVEDMINTCFSEWSSSSSGSDWSHTELASNEVFCVDYQSGNSVRIFSASSSSDEDLPPNAIEIDWSKVSSSSSSCSIDSSELFSCEDESFEEEIPQKFSVRRRQLPRRIPRSEKRKEREYKEKDRELPANDNIRSAWSRQLGSNDKLRPWTPYGPRIYQEFTLSRDQVKRLQMLYPYVCTGDFDVENMVQAFRAFCYLLYTQQWYRTNSSMDQKSDPHFWEKDICKKLYAVITGHRLQRLDGLMRPKVPLKDNALTYWIANYKFLLHCFSPVQEDAFTKRWELFYQNSQKYSATTSQIQYQGGSWFWNLFGLEKTREQLASTITNASVAIDSLPSTIQTMNSTLEKVNKLIPETTTTTTTTTTTKLDDSDLATAVDAAFETPKKINDIGSEMLSSALKDALKDVPKTIIDTLRMGLRATADSIKSLYQAAIEKCKKAFETAMGFVELLFEGCKAHRKVIMYCCLAVVLTMLMVLIYKQLKDEVLRGLFVPFCITLIATFGLAASADTFMHYQSLWLTSGKPEYQSGGPILMSILAFVGSFFNLRDTSTIMRMTTSWNQFTSTVTDGFKWLINSIYKKFTGNHYYIEYEQKEQLHLLVEKLRNFFTTPNLQHLVASDVTIGADAQRLHREALEMAPFLSTLYKHKSPAFDEIDKAFQQIKHLAAEAEMISPKTKDRIVPFVIWFDGNAGGGKSETAKNLPLAIYKNVQKALPQQYPMKWNESMNYFKADTSQFWSNYEAFLHFCCTIEEYNATADTQTRGMQTSEFLKLVSTSIMPLDQPFQNKGKSFFGSELIIVTTNMTKLDLDSASGATCPDALYRRRHLHLQSHKDKFYATPQERLENRNTAWKYFVQSDSEMATDWFPGMHEDAKKGLKLRFDDIVSLASKEIIRRIQDRDTCKVKRDNIDWTNLTPTYPPPPSGPNTPPDTPPRPPTDSSSSHDTTPDSFDWFSDSEHSSDQIVISGEQILREVFNITDDSWLDQRTQASYLYETLVRKGDPTVIASMMDMLRKHDMYYAVMWTPSNLAVTSTDQKIIDDFELKLTRKFSKDNTKILTEFNLLLQSLPKGFCWTHVGCLVSQTLLIEVRTAMFDLWLTSPPEKLPSYLKEPIQYQHDDVPWLDSAQDKYGRTWPRSKLTSQEEARIMAIRRITQDEFPRKVSRVVPRTIVSHFSSLGPIDQPEGEFYDYDKLIDYLNVFETDMVLATSPLHFNYHLKWAAVSKEAAVRLPMHNLWSPDRNERRDIKLQLLHNFLAFRKMDRNILKDDPEAVRLTTFFRDVELWHNEVGIDHPFLKSTYIKFAYPTRSFKHYGEEGSETFLWSKFARLVFNDPEQDPSIKSLKKRLSEEIESTTYRASILTSIIFDWDAWLEKSDQNYYLFTSFACLISFTLTAVLTYFGLTALLTWVFTPPKPVVDLQSLSKGQLARLNKSHKIRFQARKKTTGDKKRKTKTNSLGVPTTITKIHKFDTGEFEKLDEPKQLAYQATLQQNIAAHINKVGLNILGFKFIYDSDKSCYTYGLISGSRVFITAHFFEVYGLNFNEVQILNGDTTLHRIPSTKVTLTRLEGRDQIAMDLPDSVNPSPNLKFMSRAEFENFDLERYQIARVHKTIKKGVTSIQCVTGNNLRPGVAYEDQLTTDEGKKIRWKIDDYLVCVGSQGERGDCSLPYVACDRTTGKVFVLGTHFARLQDDSYVCPLFETDKRSALAYQGNGVSYQAGPVTRKGAWLPPCVSDTKPIYKQEFSGRLQALGEVTTPSFIPSDSNIIPSPFQGGHDCPPIKEITGFPALLRPTIFEDNPDEVIKPLHNAVDKVVSPPVTLFPSELLEWAEKEPEKAFAGFTPLQRKEFKLLTIEEALAMLSQDTAIGHDMKALGFTSRKEMWTKDEVTGLVTWVHPLVRAAVEEVFDAMKKGYQPRNVVAACLKDEIRDELRVRLGKTRLFCVGGFAHLVVTVMVMGDIVSFMKEHLGTSDVAIGVNPHSKDWTMLIRKLLQFPNLGGGDFKNYDTSIVSEFAYLLYRCMRLYTNWFITNPMWDWFLYCVCMSAVAPVIVIGTEAYLMDWMNSSGGWLTGFINSFVNVVIFNYYFEKVCQENSLDLVRQEHLAAWFYGDDNIWSVSDTVAPFFTMKKLGAFISKNFGMEYTTAEKTEITNDFVNIDDLEFLCRRFKKWQSGDMLYHAQLAEDSISQMLLWLRKPKRGVTIEQQMAINVEQALMEYYHYGQQRFEQERAALYDYSVRFNIPWKAKEFGDYHRRFADNALYC
jgi:hypothetical protein